MRKNQRAAVGAAPLPRKFARLAGQFQIERPGHGPIVRHTHRLPLLAFLRELPSLAQRKHSFARSLFGGQHGFHFRLNRLLRASVGRKHITAQIIRHPSFRPGRIPERSFKKFTVAEYIVGRPCAAVGSLGVQRRKFPALIAHINIVIAPRIGNRLTGDVRAVPPLLRGSDRRQRLKPFFIGRIFSHMIPVAPEGDGERVQRFAHIDGSARNLRSSSLAGDRKHHRT